MQTLGKGFSVIRTARSEMILSVPLELNTDHQQLITAAKDRGYVSFSIIGNWQELRFAQAIEMLISEGLVWIDEQAGSETLYWFPGMQMA